MSMHITIKKDDVALKYAFISLPIEQNLRLA